MTAWEVRTPNGALVSSLAGLATALGTSTNRAAETLLNDATLAKAAPAALLAEAKAKAKGGGDTPPPIANGSFVSWSNGKGRVDLIVTRGKVPGVGGDVEGTEKSPAARVVVWEDGKATGKKIGASTHTLRRIAPLDKPSEKKDPLGSLVHLHAEHDNRVTEYNMPGYRRLSADAVKTAYERGMQSWPGEDRTTLTAEEWAVGRAEHLVKVAAGEVQSKSAAGHDLDLLDPLHPLADVGDPAPEEGEVVTLAAADIEATLAQLRDSAAQEEEPA